MTNREKFTEVFGCEIAWRDNGEAIPGHCTILFAANKHFDEWLKREYVPLATDKNLGGMNDLISRQAAIEQIEAIFPVDPHANECAEGVAIGAALAKQFISTLPPAEPERKKGEWHITDAYPHNVYCSECYTRFAQTHWAVWEDGSLPRNFCPNCGADMRGGQDGET